LVSILLLLRSLPSNNAAEISNSLNLLMTLRAFFLSVNILLITTKFKPAVPLCSLDKDYYTKQTIVFPMYPI